MYDYIQTLKYKSKQKNLGMKERTNGEHCLSIFFMCLFIVALFIIAVQKKACKVYY